MRYLLLVICSFFICALIWLGAVIVHLGKPTQSSQWMSMAFEKKEAYAKTINNPKLVLVAGSGTLFGADSEKLEEALNIPVVNGAVTVGLGLEYILKRSKTMAKKGDIIILPLEYYFYQYDETIQDYANYIVSREPEFFLQRSLLEQFRIISRVNFIWLLDALAGHFREPSPPMSGLYSLTNINLRGDQINIEPEKMNPRIRAIISQMQPMVRTATDLNTLFIKPMDEYIAWAKSQGICLIAMPPNYVYFDEYKKPAFKTFVQNIKTYYEKHGVTFVGNPYDYMFEKTYYFNARYHLNSEGVALVTEQMIKDLGIEPASHCQPSA